jgi:hypothetical protein
MIRDNPPMTPLLLADLANTPWWKVATGILGIPAAVIGLVYSYVLIQKTRAETAKLKKDLSTQKDELNEQKENLADVTFFLFDNFINEAQLRLLERLASPDPYPLEKTGIAVEHLRHLRGYRLITVPSGIGQLPKDIRDLHDHAALTKAGSYYLERRKTLLKFDNVA